MTGATRAVLAVVVGAVLLSGCGGGDEPAAPSSSLPGTGETSVLISAEPASCVEATSGDQALACSVRVWYSNTAATARQIDTGRTRLVDAAGVLHSAVATGTDDTAPSVAAGSRVPVVWTIVLPTGTRLTQVVWIDDSGGTESVPLTVVAGSATASPEPSATASPSPTPSATPTRTATPKPTPASTPTRTRTAKPKPSSPPPPPSGSIG